MNCLYSITKQMAEQLAHVSECLERHHDAPYEKPDNPEIRMRTRDHSANELAAIILRALSERGIIEPIEF